MIKDIILYILVYIPTATVIFIITYVYYAVKKYRTKTNISVIRYMYRCQRDDCYNELGISQQFRKYDDF